MKLSLNEELKTLRRNFLARDEELFKTIPFGVFTRIKDWDDKNSTVIWEGDLEHSSLSNRYKIRILYHWLYPYRRPDIFPAEPRIVNQRHQLPNWESPKAPGSLCYMPLSPDYWHTGLTCHDIVERAVKWFRHYEAGTLSSEFAPPEIEIYYPRTHKLPSPEILAIDTLILPETKDDGSLLIIPMRSGKFALISTSDDSKTVDEKVDEIQRLKELILSGDWLDTENISHGRWFRLKNEPQLPVPINSAALMRLLRQNGFSESGIYALAKEDPRAIAVCYPTDADRLHWLLFETKFTCPNREGFRKRTYTLKLNEVNIPNQIKLHSLSRINTENIFRRVSGFEVESLLKKRCLVLGLGSLGSTIVDELAKSGVGNLTLIDKDSLEPGNVCRHRLGLNYLGQNKAEALKIELLRKNPFAKVSAFDFDVVARAETLFAHIERSDLVISCLGNDSSELFVDSLCRRANKSAIYCRSYLEGRFGELIFARSSDESACLSCIGNYLLSDNGLIPRPPEIPYHDLVRFDGGCGAVFIPASSVDLGFISLHSARLALEHLQGSDLSNSNYFIVRGREFSAREYGDLTGEIREPFRIHGYVVPRSDFCSHCHSNANTSV